MSLAGLPWTPRDGMELQPELQPGRSRGALAVVYVLSQRGCVRLGSGRLGGRGSGRCRGDHRAASLAAAAQGDTGATGPGYRGPWSTPLLSVSV